MSFDPDNFKAAAEQAPDGTQAALEEWRALEVKAEAATDPAEKKGFENKAREAKKRWEGLRDAPAPTKSLAELLAPAFDLMERRADGRAKPITTPWESLNEKIAGGLWPGLHILTGSTGTGKSQWALQVALHAAKAGTPVLYIGLELGHEDLVARLVALWLAEEDGHGPKWSDLYLGKRADVLAKAKTEHLAALAALPIRIEVAPPRGWPASALEARGKELRDLYPEPAGPGSLPMLVVLDYLQVVAPEADAQRQDLRERIGAAAYQGRALARDLGAAVLMISSVSRENAKQLTGQEAYPLGTGEAGFLVGLGKESGDIEYAANTVLAMAKGDFCNTYSEIHVAVAKLREGTTGWARLKFNGGHFWEFTKEEEEQRGKVASHVAAAGVGRAESKEATAKREKAHRKFETARAKVKRAERSAREAETALETKRKAGSTPQAITIAEGKLEAARGRLDDAFTDLAEAAEAAGEPMPAGPAAQANLAGVVTQ